MKYMMLISLGPQARDFKACRRRSSSRSTPAGRRSTRRLASRPGSSCSRRRPRRRCGSQDGQTLTTDGPYVETKEALDGYFIYEGDDLDAAIAVASRVPAAEPGRRDRDPPARGVVDARPVFREQWGRVLATLIGLLGDFDLAEEAAQDAFAIAAERWPREGVPSNPSAWLITTARNRAIDVMRRNRTLAEKLKLLDVAEVTEDDDGIHDVPRRAARADLHLLPSGAVDGGAGGADAADPGRPDDAGDRAGVPGAGGDDGAAARAREEEDQGRRHPVPGAARPPAAGPARGGAGGRLPDLQRGLRAGAATCRPRRSGSAARWPS